MANDQKPIYPQLLELPPNLTPAQFQTLVDERIRDLNLLIQQFWINPAVTDQSMGSFRITNLADPTDDLDAVNLRTLKRFGGAPSAPVASSGGLDAYAMVFANGELANTGDLVPAYVVGSDRSGVTEEAWVYARGAPVTDFTFNLARDGVNLLPSDLTLPAGSNGPVFRTVGSISVRHGDVIYPVIVAGGGAVGVSIGLVVKRS